MATVDDLRVRLAQHEMEARQAAADEARALADAEKSRALRAAETTRRLDNLCILLAVVAVCVAVVLAIYVIAVNSGYNAYTVDPSVEGTYTCRHPVADAGIQKRVLVCDFRAPLGPLGGG